jgi:hypothetical protein
MTPYESFCHRMWLDYCDENNDVLSERLTYEEYITKWRDYLEERYVKRIANTFSVISH